MFKKGFTLAEVLISLSLIGVISTLTVPSLVNNTNVNKKVAAYKKAVSTLSDAFAGASASSSNFINNTKVMLDTMVPHMSVKYYYSESNGTYTLANSHGVTGKQNNVTSNWIISNDGIGYRLTYVMGTAGCTKDMVTANIQTASNALYNPAYVCAYFLVDIDGPKRGDNTVATVTSDNNGKIKAISGDRFYIGITSDGLATGNPDVVPGAKILAAEN